MFSYIILSFFISSISSYSPNCTHPDNICVGPGQTYLLLQTGINAVTKIGQKVYIKGDTYYVNSLIIDVFDGTQSSPIEFLPFPLETVIIINDCSVDQELLRVKNSWWLIYNGPTTSLDNGLLEFRTCDNTINNNKELITVISSTTTIEGVTIGPLKLTNKYSTGTSLLWVIGDHDGIIIDSVEFFNEPLNTDYNRIFVLIDLDTQLVSDVYSGEWKRLWIKNCRFLNVEYQGIVNEQSYYITIEGNYFTTSSASTVDPVVSIKNFLSSHHVNIFNNIIDDQMNGKSSYMYFHVQSSYVQDVFFVMNNLVNCHESAHPLIKYESEISLDRFRVHVWYNNYFRGNCSYGNYIGLNNRRVFGCYFNHNWFDVYRSNAELWDNLDGFYTPTSIGYTGITLFGLLQRPDPYFNPVYNVFGQSYSPQNDPELYYDGTLRVGSLTIGPFPVYVCPLGGNWDAAQGCSVCRNKWEGNNCTTCPDWFNPSPDCSVCQINFNISDECKSCSGNWDLSTNCSTCINSYKQLGGCVNCLPNYNISTDCTLCNENYNLTDDCSSCNGNWDFDDTCSTCRDGWVNSNDDCSTCIGNWDVSLDCAECKGTNYDTEKNCDGCIDHWDVDMNCTSCLTNWNPDSNCTECISYWGENYNCLECKPNYNKTDNCNTCFSTYNFSTDCTECIKGRDIDSNCTTCSTNWNTDSGCTECIPNWDISQNCEECLPDWDKSTDCSSCKFFRDESKNCAECKYTWLYQGDCRRCKSTTKLDPTVNCTLCKDRTLDHKTDCTSPIPKAKLGWIAVVVTLPIGMIIFIIILVLIFFIVWKKKKAYDIEKKRKQDLELKREKEREEENKETKKSEPVWMSKVVKKTDQTDLPRVKSILDV